MNGVLLIHGFTGNRGEVEPLGRYLSERGFRTAMPCLTGHESSMRQLAAATYRDWVADAVSAYDALARECDSVAVVGFSMGGLLAAQLYQTRPFCRLVTVNTPIYYWNFLAASACITLCRTRINGFTAQKAAGISSCRAIPSPLSHSRFMTFCRDEK